MLEKGPSGQPPPARVDLSLLAPAARRLLPFPCSRANRDQKHGSYGVSNCHNVFNRWADSYDIWHSHEPWLDARVSMFISNIHNLANNGHFVKVDHAESLRRKALITPIQFLCGWQIHTAFVDLITSSLRGQ